jgi:N-ethylmaleimide reductase
MQELKASHTTDLFNPVEVGPRKLPNRVVMAPLTRSRAGPGNVPTQLNALYYAQRASAGLIIAEATQVAGHEQQPDDVRGLLVRVRCQGRSQTLQLVWFVHRGLSALAVSYRSGAMQNKSCPGSLCRFNSCQ